MAIGTVAFNDIASSGYSASANAVEQRDIMKVWDAYAAPAPGDDFYENTNYGGAYGSTVMPDPIYGEQQTFTQSLVEGNTRQESLMETMFPDKSYAAPKVNAQSMMRDANKVVTDGAKVSRQANMAMEDTKSQIASFQQDWKQAKAEAFESFIDSVPEGVNPMDAANQMLPEVSPGKADAMLYVAASVAVGGGTFAAAAMEYMKTPELSKADKLLSPDQQKKIMEDTLTQLQQSRKSPDTRQEASVSGAAEVVDDAPQSGVAWENMEIDDLIEFMGADSDGLDQPEMQELLQMEHDLEIVLDNHEYVQEHYGDVITADKMYASASTGNEQMVSVLADAEVVQAMPVLDEVPRYDSLDGMLAGDSVRGVTLLASDTRFDSSGVQTVLDLTKVNTSEAERQLTADIEQQFKAGMM